MKISKFSKKEKGHRSSSRNITEIEKAIAVIKKFNKDEGSDGGLKIFISSGTVIVKKSDDIEGKLDDRNFSGAISRLLGNCVTQNYIVDSSKKLSEIKARYAAIQEIINASNSETEKAISTLLRKQTDEEKNFYSSLKNKLIDR